MPPSHAGTAYVDIRGNFSQMEKGLTTRLGARRFGRLGKAAGAAFVLGAAGAGIAKVGFDIAKSFDDAFDTIRGGTGKTGKSLKRLEQDFKAVVRTVPVDFGTAADAITGVNQRLDLTGKPLRRLTRQFTELSRVTKTDVKENVSSVTRAFVDWEIKTGRMSSKMDLLFRASQRSGASVSELARLVVQFGAPLRQVGFSLDESVAMFASFEKAGVNIQTMMPGLKFALKEFLTKDLDPKKELVKTFEGIKDGTIKTSDAMALFGQRAGPDMVEAIQQGRFNLDAFLKTIREGSDTIRKAGRDTGDLGEEWTLLKNNIKVGLEPVLKRAFDSVGKLSADLRKIWTNSNDATTFGHKMHLSLVRAFGSDKTAMIEKIGGQIKAIGKALLPVVKFAGRAALGIGKFAAAHPKITATAGAIFLAGKAINAFKTAKAVKGIGTLLGSLRRLAQTKAGERAAEAVTEGLGSMRARATGRLNRFRDWFGKFMGRSGSRAGARTAENVASTVAADTPGHMGKKVGPLMGRGGRIGSMFAKWGKAIGRGFGVAAIIAIGLELAGWDAGKALKKAKEDIESGDWKHNLGPGGFPGAMGGPGDPRIGMARGGVVAPRGAWGRPDQHLRMLKSQEHIFTEDEVRAGGGHRGMFALRRALKGGVRKMAMGGPVDRVNVAPGQADTRGLKNVPATYKKLRTDSRKHLLDLQADTKKTFKESGDDGQKRTKRLHKDVDDELGGLNKDAKKRGSNYHRLLDKAFTDTKDDGAKRTQAMKRVVGARLGDMVDDGSKKLRRLARTAEARFEDMASSGRVRGRQLTSSVSSSMTSTDRAVYTGMSYIATATNKALKSFDAKPVNITIARPKGLARGGVPNPGAGAGDDHMLLDPSGRPVAALSGTEGIVNRPQMQEINRALGLAHGLGASRYGGLGDLWGSGMKHFAGGGSIVPIPGMPGESIHRSIVKDVVGMIRAYKMRVTDGYATSGHSAAGEHPLGLAIDVVPGSGGSWGLIGKAMNDAGYPNPPNPPFRWLGWNNEANHGAGNHGHFSWNRGQSGFKSASAEIPKIRVGGTQGPLRDLVQAVMTRTRRAADSFVNDKAASTVGDAFGSSNFKGSWVKRLKQIAADRGWSVGDWMELVRRESGGNPEAVNPSSGAFGLGQFLGSTKDAYAKYGATSHDPVRQIEAMAKYIADRYGSPSSALSFHSSHNWYRKGGPLNLAKGGLLKRFAGGGRFDRRKHMGGDSPSLHKAGGDWGGRARAIWRELRDRYFHDWRHGPPQITADGGAGGFVEATPDSTVPRHVHIAGQTPGDLLRGNGEGEVELIHEMAHSEQRQAYMDESTAETFAHHAASQINPYSGFGHGRGASWAYGRTGTDPSWWARDMFLYGRAKRPGGGGGGGGKKKSKPKKASLAVPGFSGGKVRSQTASVDTRFKGKKSLWNPFMNRYEKMSDNRLRAIMRKWFRLHPRQAFKSGPDQRLLWNPFKKRKQWMGPHFFSGLVRKWQKKHPGRPFPSEGGGRQDEQVSLGGSEMGRIEAGIAMAGLTPGTEDDVKWVQRKLGLEERQLEQARKNRNWERVTELAGAIISDRETLAELKGGTQSEADLAEQFKALTDELRTYNRNFSSVEGIVQREGLRAFADSISGQIGGRIDNRRSVAGIGTVATA